MTNVTERSIRVRTCRVGIPRSPKTGEVRFTRSADPYQELNSFQHTYVVYIIVVLNKYSNLLWTLLLLLVGVLRPSWTYYILRSQSVTDGQNLTVYASVSTIQK